MKRSLAILVPSLAAVIVFGNTPARGLWAEQEAKLLPSDGATEDHFGIAVALDGDTAIIGASLDDDNGSGSGSAYVFTRTRGVWTEQAKLLPADGATEESFGWSLALDGNTAVVGAPVDDDNGYGSGSAYVFTRTGDVWVQQAKLLPSDAGFADRFGWSVAIDGDTAVIGAAYDDDNGEDSGSAYVFTRTGGLWTERAKLLPFDGATDDRFGWSVALDGDTAMIGAPSHDDFYVNSGSVYVFTRTGGMWAELSELLAADGAPQDSFGGAVAIDGDTAIVGARGDDDNGYTSGSAYVFTSTGNVWTEQAKLLAADGSPADQFGKSVALDGDTTLIGAFRDDVYGEPSGSAYVFTRTGGGWTQQAKLLPPDSATYDEFGSAAALDGDTAVIGAPSDDDNGEDSGSAYVFRLYDDDVPATNIIGLALLFSAVLASGAYLARRQATD